MKFLAFIFIIFIFIVLFGLIFIGNIIKTIFSFGHHSQQREKSQEQDEQQPSQQKIFDENEGEYVDFEEIKDGKKE